MLRDFRFLPCVTIRLTRKAVSNARPIPDLERSQQKNPDLKNEVREFWNSDPCGTRYLDGENDKEVFAAHERARYRLEPYIPEFAQFASSRGLKVLEIGVGMGADYLQWLKAGALVTGIDMSAASVERAERRCAIGWIPRRPAHCRRGAPSVRRQNL